jgi:hypothetical protein
MEEFQNLPLTDFSQPENRQAMTSAIDRVRGQLGREYDIVIGAERIRCKEQFQSLNPSRKGEVVGIFQEGTATLGHGDTDTGARRHLATLGDTATLVDEAISVADGAFGFRHPCFAKLWD